MGLDSFVDLKLAISSILVVTIIGILTCFRNDYYSPYISLRVKRDDILGSTMQKIGQQHGRKLRTSMSVVFEDEPGKCAIHVENIVSLSVLAIQYRPVTR